MAKPGKSVESPIYQLTVTLRGVEPPVWRRVLVPIDVTLDDLHYVIQAVMGWGNEHMYQFIAKGGSARRFYLEPYEDYDGKTESARLVRLSEVVPRAGCRLVYEYDFGDNWKHDILAEKRVPREAGVKYPVCISGERACPPEDCGGICGYERFLEAIANPHHPDHEETLEWIGFKFNAEKFDLDRVNRALRKCFRLGI